MFDWLFEGRNSVYVVLAALAVFLLLVWWQTRKRWFLVGVAVAVGLVGLYALLDKTVETDREQIVRKVQEMAAAANARDLDGLFDRISDNFHSPQGKDKQQLRDTFANYLQMGIVSNVRVWDIVCVDRPSREHPPARVFFSAKAESEHELLADCEATFDYDPDRGWRLRSIRLLKPQTTEEWSIQF
ncbi:MAG TPA: hypothetical protein VMF69_25845 [Gemmataceae bacterium]|nr:hypothetical protein [Gemmataceae bacterium]